MQQRVLGATACVQASSMNQPGIKQLPRSYVCPAHGERSPAVGCAGGCGPTWPSGFYRTTTSVAQAHNTSLELLTHALKHLVSAIHALSYALGGLGPQFQPLAEAFVKLKRQKKKTKNPTTKNKNNKNKHNLQPAGFEEQFSGTFPKQTMRKYHLPLRGSQQSSGDSEMERRDVTWVAEDQGRSS